MALDRFRAPPRCHGAAGFSLIEMLVAVVLLGILASIAWPTFGEQVARARRSELQAALLDDAGYMQRYYAANNAYGATPAPNLTSPVSPRAGAPAYRIAVGVPSDDPTHFTLTATRVGAMQGDRCGDFTYDDLGRRGLVPGTSAPGLTAARCWR